MEVEAKPDFSGWASKAGLKCSDGRIILPGAFKHQDNVTVPLVWQHNHNSPDNVLGYAILEHRDEGVYTYGYFNDTPQGKNARVLVHHGDVKSLSIYANQLTERAKQVLHGIIREVSLVLSGANPGALIDNITLAHADGNMVTLEDEAIIYTGLEIRHSEELSEESEAPSEESEESSDAPSEESNKESSDAPNEEESDETVQHSDEAGDSTVQEVYDSMTEDQKNVVHFLVGSALENAENAAHSDDSNESDESDDDLSHTTTSEEEGRHMTRNVFEEQNKEEGETSQHLSHDAMVGIVEDAKKLGSLKEAVENYAFKHGIENIDVLFPDARTLTPAPEFDKRRTEWVVNVLNTTRHSPFSRIKSIIADITFDEARAKGYVKGNLKKEEFFGVSKRTTTPTTVYKKQKLDRDDILDITDFDVVVWLKSEMRLMLDEELARAILIGDGRAVDDDDKIKDPVAATDGVGIRSILHEHDLYAATVTVADDATATETVDGIIGAMGFYKGSGSPTMYTTLPNLTSLLLERDSLGHRLWKTPSELAGEMGVDSIVIVDVMEDEPDLVGIIVNLTDYTVGADRGGEVNFFDDFDIDYNQYKYLLETRISGSLTRIRSAVIIKRASTGDTMATPAAPTFDPETGNITINNTTGVVYKRADTDAVVNNAGSPYNVAAGDSLTIYAEPATDYYFENNIEDQWTFHHEA